jgi:hypothetical protein
MKASVGPTNMMLLEHLQNKAENKQDEDGLNA